MIQQRSGDLLEIEYEERIFYVVVLTKIVLFGGNVVFAHHTDGTRRDLDWLLANRQGFNICTDLLMPKKEGDVVRLHRFDDVSPYWKTRYVKNCHEHRRGEKAAFWFLERIEQDGTTTDLGRRRWLRPRYRKAMDSGMYSFDLVAEKILARYTPDQNQHL